MGGVSQRVIFYNKGGQGVSRTPFLQRDFIDFLDLPLRRFSHERRRQRKLGPLGLLCNFCGKHLTWISCLFTQRSLDRLSTEWHLLKDKIVYTRKSEHRSLNSDPQGVPIVGALSIRVGLYEVLNEHNSNIKRHKTMRLFLGET